MPGLRRSRAAGALTALAAAVLTLAVLTLPSYACRPDRGTSMGLRIRLGGPAIGPVQINPVGHPRLCWQAGGNGSGRHAWSAATPPLAGPAMVADQQRRGDERERLLPGRPGQAAALYIDFAGQCAGEGRPEMSTTDRGQV